MRYFLHLCFYMLQVGGAGGGVIHMEASYRMLLDGEVKANGSSAESGAGGGAGGSVVLKAAHFSGE